jgi:hypothetical protein
LGAVGSVPFSRLDRVAQYGRDYPALGAAKATLDPPRVLARPGQASSTRRADPVRPPTQPGAAVAV